MSIYVAGSLAFDRIMSFNGAFADHILADKLHILNVSFLIDGLVEKRGGCAGNIAYTLALMGEKPLILATAGKNFSEYGTFLESKGISLEGVRVMKDEFTASCTLITDKNNNQINGFHPAAMGFPCEYAFPHPDASADWGIVSPGNLDDMKALPRLFREKGIRYIYDPGQQIPALSGDDLLDAITGSALLVTNDYELEMISKATQRTRAELRALTGGVITTLGEQGSVIDNGERGSVGIAAPKPWPTPPVRAIRSAPACSRASCTDLTCPLPPGSARRAPATASSIRARRSMCLPMRISPPAIAPRSTRNRA